jgi:hypothetical protein
MQGEGAMMQKVQPAAPLRSWDWMEHFRRSSLPQQAGVGRPVYLHRARTVICCDLCATPSLLPRWASDRGKAGAKDFAALVALSASTDRAFYAACARERRSCTL